MKSRTEEEFPIPIIKTHPLLWKAHCSAFKHYGLSLVWIPWFYCYNEKVPVLLQAKKILGLSGADRPCLATRSMPWSRAVMVAAAEIDPR